MLATVRTHGGGFQTLNRWLYRSAHALADARGGRLAACTRAPADAAAPVLLLQNGRLGDAMLAAAFTARYREWFGRKLVAVGRPETTAIVAPCVDVFVPFDGTRRSAARARAAIAGRYSLVLGDLHLFHGGRPLLALARSAAAPEWIFHEGWIDRARQAPGRRFPAGALVVPMRDKQGGGTDPERLHVFADLLDYHRAVLERLGLPAGGLPSRPALPAASFDHAGAQALAAPQGCIACQPSSSQPKKDWPWPSFLALFAAFPQHTFVLLGNGSPGGPLPPNAIDLRGRTSVPQALAIVARAQAFVGVDSALAHGAAIQGIATLVPMPASTPGFFFPYPEALLRAPMRALWATEFTPCAGCGGICGREPLWTSRRRGFPCLRALGVGPLVDALAELLAQPRAAAARGEPVAAGARD